METRMFLCLHIKNHGTIRFCILLLARPPQAFITCSMNSDKSLGRPGYEVLDLYPLCIYSHGKGEH